ncbi:MAG: hypothetical protein ACREJU_19675 [Nitrospiraceae bacterium]
MRGKPINSRRPEEETTVEEMAWGMIVAGCVLFGMLAAWILYGLLQIFPRKEAAPMDDPQPHETHVRRAT